MFLSPREKEILIELMNHPSGVSINQMIGLLKVSKRTVYRELENLEESLRTIGASLNKISRGIYQLNVSDEKRETILKSIQTDMVIDLSTNERQKGILMELLVTETPVVLQVFLDKYQISNTTFYGDIKQLEERLAKSPLKIVRNLGYEVVGSEKYRRLLMANILQTEINEYQFFHYQESTKQSNFFFQFLNNDYVTFVKDLVIDELRVVLPQLSDRKLAHLVLVLIITIERVSKGHLVVEEAYVEQLNKEMLQVVKEIFTKLAMRTKQLYPVNEIVFYTSLLSDFANSFEEDFFEENFNTELAYLVRSLIEGVSQETEVNFFEDAYLYKMLLTHLSGVFSRVILQEEVLINPILERIMEQYSDVVEGIYETLPKVFPGKVLSEEEIAYMVLHFANSLERSPKIIEVDIAGFSPSGLASTSMLEMRLRKSFPFINKIDFFSIAQLGMIDFEKKYDVIISTALLPGYSGSYQLVSPLLLDDEINQLKNIFKEIGNKKKKTKTKVYSENEVVSHSYEEVLQFMDNVNELLERFFIKKIANEASQESIIRQVIECLPAKLILDRQEIEQQLIRRLNQTPFGIPGTSMALFHGATKGVKEPIFCIIDLEKETKILGMDRIEIGLTRVLLMLAPENVEPIESQLLGKISSALIMNDLYTEIFRSGNEAIVYQLLSSLLIEEIIS